MEMLHAGAVVDVRLRHFEALRGSGLLLLVSIAALRDATVSKLSIYFT